MQIAGNGHGDPHRDTPPRHFAGRIQDFGGRTGFGVPLGFGDSLQHFGRSNLERRVITGMVQFQDLKSAVG